MADQKINALPVKTAPATGDKMLMIGAAEEYQIDYDQLATAILNKLTSKTYALDQGTKTLVAALNELNSNTQKKTATCVLPEGITRLAGYSYAVGDVLYINECLNASSQLSPGTPFVENITIDGISIDGHWAYGLFSQNNNDAKHCLLNGKTINVANFNVLKGWFVIVVTAYIG